MGDNNEVLSAVVVSIRGKIGGLSVRDDHMQVSTFHKRTVCGWYRSSIADLDFKEAFDCCTQKTPEIRDKDEELLRFFF